MLVLLRMFATVGVMMNLYALSVPAQLLPCLDNQSCLQVSVGKVDQYDCQERIPHAL
jgi:hypothetical protein